MNALVVLALYFAPPAPLELPRLLDEVAANAPQVRARDAQVDVARSRVGVAGAWEDPSLTIMTESIPLPGGEMGDPTMITYRFSQPLNLFGRRSAAKDTARARIGIDQAQAVRARWDARAQAVALFYELWMNGEMRALLER